MPDYTKLAATASRLVTNAGRTITLVQFNSTPAEASKPWRGATTPRTDPDATLEVSGVFVEPSSAVRLGMSTEISDLLKRSTQIIIVAATADLSGYQEIIDSDTKRWKIVGMEKLQPADTTLLYFIGVAR